jgi:hypothetical protein
MPTPTNVDRLVAVGLIDASALTQAGTDAINEITITDIEMQSLVSIKAKLDFDPLKPTGPTDQTRATSGVSIWRL